MVIRLWNVSRTTFTRAVMFLFLMGAAQFAVSPCRAQGPAPTSPDLETSRYPSSE